MKPTKPFLFLGSSREANDKGLIDKFSRTLSTVAHCVPWTIVPEFSNAGSATTFEALQRAANEYDFAVILLTPDDVSKSRGTDYSAARDNLWYELGLFTGTIGPDRVMMAKQRDAQPDMRIPSDLNGVSCPEFLFDPNNELETIASVNNAGVHFVNTIRAKGFRQLDLPLASEWYVYDKSRTKYLFVKLSPAMITRHRPLIANWQLAIAARLRKKGETVDFEHDEHVCYSEPRKLPDIVNDPIEFDIQLSRIALNRRPMQPGDEVQARVLLIPPGATTPQSMTIVAARQCRCRDVERMSYNLVGEAFDSSPGAKASTRKVRTKSKSTPRKKVVHGRMGRKAAKKANR